MTDKTIRGADVSTLLEVEERGGKFFDLDGTPGEAMEILKRHGFGLIRLRLWNDPYGEDGTPYGAGTCDLELRLLGRPGKADNPQGVAGP